MDFPLELFPRVIRDAAEGMTKASNVPPELTVLTMLGLASVAAQSVWNAKADWGEVPCSLNVCVLMKSGGQKSTAMKPLNRGYDSYCEIMEPIFATAMAQYRAEETDWQIQLKDAKGERDPSIRMGLLTALEQSKPVRPASPYHQIENPSGVGLTRAFQNFGPSIGIVSTEAGAFLKGHAMSDSAISQQLVSLLSKVWSGESYDRLTSEEQERIVGVRNSCVWLLQDEMAADFINNPMFAAQGILARFLIVQAPSFEKPLATFYSDPERSRRMKQERDDACREFCRRVAMIYAKADLMLGKIDPQPMEWDDSAFEVGEAWVNDFANRWANLNPADGCDDHQHHKSFFQRLEEHALRIATVLSAVEGRTTLSRDNLVCAQKLVEYLTHARLKIEAHETPVEGDEYKATKALRGYLSSRIGETLTARDIKRACKRGDFAKAPKRIQDAAINQMVDLEILKPVRVTSLKNVEHDAFQVCE